MGNLFMSRQILILYKDTKKLSKLQTLDVAAIFGAGYVYFPALYKQEIKNDNKFLKLRHFLTSLSILFINSQIFYK